MDHWSGLYLFADRPDTHRNDFHSKEVDPYTTKEIVMSSKFAMAAIATVFLAATAVAQSTTTDPKTGVGPNAPTDAQCKAGYKDGMQWKKSDFDTACAKMRERKEKTQ
jgi:hypothetical protein